MINIERELKSIRKLLAENTITNEALKENIREMSEILKNNLTTMNENFEKLSKDIEDYENNLESKIVASLEKFIHSSTS